MTLEDALLALREATLPSPPTTTLDEVQAQMVQTYADWDASAKDIAAMQALSTRLRELADTTQSAVDAMHCARGRFITTTRALDNLRLRLVLAGHSFSQTGQP